jgi:tetratricopeptide (TPR) repeat protein
MASSRKSGARVNSTVRRKRNLGRAKVRSRHVEAARTVSGARPAAGHEARISPQRTHADVEYQTAIKNFAVGVRAFQRQDYVRAAVIFEKLVDSDARDVAERAQMHLRLCRQRTRRSAPAPKSADDHYALGIACLNVRNLGQAVEHLSKADKIKPNQDHVHYALAVSHALGGNTDAAFAHLEAAFALRPENRIHARRDEDFQGLLEDPRFRRLVSSAESA